jgi:hypothetical protein
MLDTSLALHNRDSRSMFRAAVRVSVEERFFSNPMLVRYLEGWAEANPAKILDATDPGYSFHDPLVGRFSRHSLPEYFEQLQVRFARAGRITRQDLLFRMHGPVDRPSHDDELEFWREAPRIGLTGTSQIKTSQRGVLAETVAYDLNLASRLLTGLHMTCLPLPTQRDLEGTFTTR